MAQPSELLEQIKQALGDLPERLAAALEKDRPAPAKPKLLVAREVEDERRLWDVPVAELLGLDKPPEALPVADDDPELDQYQPTERRKRQERENAELYDAVFAEAGQALDNHPPDALPADAPVVPPGPEADQEGGSPLGRPAPSAETEAGFDAAGEGAAPDLTEVVALLTRIAEAVEALRPDKPEKAAPSHPTAGAVRPTQWKPAGGKE